MKRLFLLLLLLAGPTYATDGAHVCGQGPHTITVQEPGSCPDACKTSRPTLMPDGSYMGTSFTTCTLAICYSGRVQTWTDWPECPDSKVLMLEPTDVELLGGPN